MSSYGNYATDTVLYMHMSFTLYARSFKAGSAPSDVINVATGGVLACALFITCCSHMLCGISLLCRSVGAQLTVPGTSAADDILGRAVTFAGTSGDTLYYTIEGSGTLSVTSR